MIELRRKCEIPIFLPISLFTQFLRNMLSSHKSSSFYALHILLPLFLSCTAYSIVRRTIGEAAPKLISEGFMTQSNYAILNTSAFIIYGLSKFVTGRVAKSRLFLYYSILFLCVGIFTFFCGMFCGKGSSQFGSFFVAWVFNYMFMGTLWPIICIIFKQWLPDNSTFIILFSPISSWILLVCNLLL